MASTRRLAAILAADVVGFHSRIDADLGGAQRALQAIRRDLFDPAIAAHNGKLLRESGDLSLVEFGNVLEALNCAIHLHRTVAEHNRNLPAGKRIEFRIGIHQGDVVIQDGHLFGDGVNTAVGLEGLAEPGGICLSARAKEDAAGKLAVQFEDMGEQRFKNRSHPVRTYQISPAGASSVGISERATRRLAAILAADVAGYSRLMGADEEGTHERLTAHLRWLAEPKIAEHRGRIVKNTGDGFLAEFPSVVDAVRCAVEVQRAMVDRERGVPEERRITFRMGINLGDVIVEEHDIFGDGVNVAARLEALADPGGICVSRVVRDQVRDKLDFTFEDMGKQQVKNIARPVRVYRVRDPAVPTEEAPPAAAQPLPLPDKPSIAVLPFANMSGDPEQDYFVDGIVEEITTAISRLSWLFVIARNSSFTYKGKSVDVKQVARELGVRYVLEGSVRKASNRVRITGQLIDTTTGAHIWADRFDGALDDIFELQDQVASSVAGAIEPKLRQSEIERASRKPTTNPTAYDLYLRALAQSSRYTEEGFAGAVVLARQALTIDPSYAPAAAMVGWCRLLQRVQGWGALSDEDIGEACRLARQALEGERDDAETIWHAAYTLFFLAGEAAMAATALDRALALNPNAAHAWLGRGLIHALRNEPEAAIEAIERARRLSPFDPYAFGYAVTIAFAHLAARRFEQAIEWADRALHDQPRLANAMRVKVVALAHLGRFDEARAELSRVLAIDPKLTIAGFRTFARQTPELLELFVTGLRLAGLPEE